MEKIQFDYATKNIPIPHKTTYKVNLLSKVESVIKRMRWKALFFLNPPTETQQNKFNLKSRKCPPPIDEMKPFEEDMFKMIENIKFKHVKNQFQNKLKSDIKKINESDKVFVFADKTRNMYKLSKDEHDKLLRENITKSYRLTDQQSTNLINEELKNITADRNIGDRIETMAKKQAFITLKDHKENFLNKPTCRLINPAKSNLGLVSKQILEEINNTVRSSIGANQWKNSQSVIKWFHKLQDKQRLTFLVFDIVDFYPSISEDLLMQSLEYASQFTTITNEDTDIIMHARKSLLFDQKKPWCKKTNTNMFDVTMGSYDGAEVCELVGLFILQKLSTKYNNNDIGLYRDDGLAVFRNIGPRSADRLRKQFSDTFAEVGLKITVESNLKSVNYLDITLNLANGKYYPYRKPDNPPLYINVHSNHPPSIVKQIPRAISNRISSLSCDAHEFEKAAPTYNEALKASGFNESISFTDHSNTSKTQRRNRPRNVIWFNPPYSINVQTDVGRSFLHLIDRHFPRSHVLHKIFNRSTTKVSYSCMNNMANIIKRHNAKILKVTDTTAEKSCNCRDKSTCPLAGDCLTSNLVYKATVTAQDHETKHYIGMTEHQFKIRYNNHKFSIKNKKHSGSTALSKYIWELKEANVNHSIKWSIVMHASAYNGSAKHCHLRKKKKMCILNADSQSLLNKRTELISKCRHENKFYANNVKRLPT